MILHRRASKSNLLDETQLVKLLNKAAGHLASDQPQKAISVCDRVIKKIPSQPAALSLSGLALCMTGRQEKGITRLEKAAASIPDDAGLAMNLANGLNQSGRYAEAADRMRALIAREPNWANAHNLLAIALEHQDRPLEAADAYRNAITLDGNNPDFFSNLIRLSLTTGPLIAVLNEAGIAQQKWPDSPEFGLLLASVLRNIGRGAEAIEVCHSSLEKAPGNTALTFLLGELYADMGDQDNARDIFEHLISAGQATDDVYFSLASIASPNNEALLTDRIRTRIQKQKPSSTLHFALARAHETAGEYTAAFKNTAEGNRLTQTEFGNFDIDQALSVLETIKDAFSDAVFNKTHTSGFTAGQPIFIVGMPRSGSTLIEQILANHPQIHALGETIDLYLVANAEHEAFEAHQTTLDTHGKIRAMAAMPQSYFTDLGARIWRVMQAFNQESPKITDKMLGNFYYIGLVKLALPNAKIIHCTRNAVDTCLSCYQKHFRAHNLMTCDLRTLGKFYTAYAGLMDHWHRTLPGFVYDVEYEGLTRDPEGTLRPLLTYLDLPFDPSCLKFNTSIRTTKTASRGQVQKSIYQTSVDRWRRYEQFLGPLLEELGPLAKHP